MRLFEYQAKGIFQKYCILVPKNQVTSNAALAEQIREEIGDEVVLKAQVLTRGRAKAGGIRLIHPKDDIASAAAEILDLSIGGLKVKKVLIEEAVQVNKQFFLKLEVDPYMERPVFTCSKFEVRKSLTNGMEANENRIRVPIELSVGLLDYQIRKIAVTLEIGKDMWDKFSRILFGMWKIFRELDAETVEINPLIINESAEMLALGAIIDLDENALFRHPDIFEKKETVDESQLRAEAEKFGITPWQYDGKISCMIDGVGFGFAIVDTLHSLGGEVGILLDVGGGAGDEKISAGLDILFRDKKTESVLIAIFGGLTCCDRIAHGILKSLAKNSTHPPLVVYLNGTHSEAGKTLLNQHNLIFEESLIAAVKKSFEIIKKENI